MESNTVNLEDLALNTGPESEVPNQVNIVC